MSAGEGDRGEAAESKHTQLLQLCSGFQHVRVLLVSVPTSFPHLLAAASDAIKRSSALVPFMSSLL